MINDTDVDGDTLTIANVNTNTTGSRTLTLDGPLLLIPANVTNGDTFTYTISDGHGGTATGMATNCLTSSYSRQTQIISATYNTGTGKYQVAVQFFGMLNTQYSIERATDPNFTLNLTTLGPVVAGSAGVINYTDTNASSGGYYYRLTCQ